jgi:nitroreductase
VLARHQSQPSTQLAPAAELPRVADRGNQRGGGQRTNSLDRHQTPGELVRAGDAAHEVARLCYTAALSEAAAVIVLTGISAKSRLKYGERGYRFTLLEAGHIAQNALLTASALMLDACPFGGFIDDLDRLLGIDGLDEVSLYLVAVGRGAR